MLDGLAGDRMAGSKGLGTSRLRYVDFQHYEDWVGLGLGPDGL